MRMRLMTAALLLTAVPAFAESHGEMEITASGDAAAGEAAFRQCQTCHVVMNEAGETLAGRAAKTGPNLYGLAGRTAGTAEEYKYSDSMKAAGEKGLVWDEEHFVGFVQDPTTYLRDYLEDTGARSAMTFKVRKEEDAKNLFAYLLSLAPKEE